MTTATLTSGAAAPVLGAEALRRIVREALSAIPPGARVLAVIPDKTRDDNTDLLFPMLSQALAERGAAQFDANVELLIWLGQRYPSLTPYAVGSTLIGHFHLGNSALIRCRDGDLGLQRDEQVPLIDLSVENLER